MPAGDVDDGVGGFYVGHFDGDAACPGCWSMPMEWRRLLRSSGGGDGEENILLTRAALCPGRCGGWPAAESVQAGSGDWRWNVGGGRGHG